MNLINIPYDGGIRLVQAEQIIRVQAQSNYSTIYFAQGYPMTVSKVLHWFQDKLPVQLFSRVHRSHLVNKMYMTEITGTGNSKLLLSNGEKINISRRKKHVLV